MLNVILLQRGLELPALVGAESALRIGADYRTGSPDRFQRPGVAAVEGSYGFQARITAGPGDGKAATHTKANGSYTVIIYLGKSTEIGERRFELVQAAVLERREQQRRHEPGDAYRAITRGKEVDGQGGVTRLGKTSCYRLDVLVQTINLVDHDYSGKRSSAFGFGQV